MTGWNTDDEERLRQYLQPDDASVQRVKARALLAVRRRGLRAAPVVVFVAAVVVLLLLLPGTLRQRIATRLLGTNGHAAAERQWLAHATGAQTLSLQTDGDLMLVRSPSGETTLLGPARVDEPPPGTMEIVLEGDQE